MKIDIITFHRAHNYGAVLQCYALQEVLKARGVDVEIIDYRQSYIEWMYSPHLALKYIIKLLCHLEFSKLSRHFRTYKQQKIKTSYFTEFIANYLHCSKEKGISQDCSVYIIGSDQMWSAHCTNGYDPIYWGNFERPIGSKLYGYSISANGDYKTVLTDLEIIENIKNFDAISFREDSVRDDIGAICGKKFPITLDPTLLTESSLWESIIKDEWANRKYIVNYQIRRKKSDPAMIDKEAISYAKNYGYEVVDLSEMSYSVEDFVSAIKYAQCVFTSSFHATVFSIIFRKRFVTYLLGDAQDNRYNNLLRLLKLEKHLCYTTDGMEEIPLCSDSVALKRALTNLREESFKYLDEIISMQ